MQSCGHGRRATNRGFLLTEAVVGMFVLAVIMGGILVALQAQTRAATRTLRRARGRLLLEGELEIMRGRLQLPIRRREAAQFEPALGRPSGLDGVSFYKTVRRAGGGQLARVKLWATRQDKTKDEEWISLEGLVYVSRGEDS